MKKYNKLYILLIYLIFINCSKSEDLLFPKVLNNKITFAHSEIEGTKFSIVLPTFMNQFTEIKQTYLGKVNNDSCTIFFRENNEINYYHYQEGFKDRIMQSDFYIEEETHLKINNYPAVIYYANKDKETGYYLLLGDSTFIAYIISVHQNGSQKLRKEIFKSLNTICYDADIEPYK